MHSLILTVAGDRYPDSNSSRENSLEHHVRKKGELKKKKTGKKGTRRTMKMTSASLNSLYKLIP